MEISIRSTGSAKDLPREAVISFSIQATCSSLEGAKDLQAKRALSTRNVLSEFAQVFSYLAPVACQEITSRREEVDSETNVRETKWVVTAHRVSQFAEVMVHDFNAEVLAQLIDRLSEASGGNVSTNFVLSEAQRGVLHEQALKASFKEAVRSAITITKLVYDCEHLYNKKADLYLKSAGMSCGSEGGSCVLYEEASICSPPKGSERAKATAPVCEPQPVSVTVDYVFDTKVGDSSEN